MNVTFPNLGKDGMRSLLDRTAILLNPKRGKAINFIQKWIVLSTVPCLFLHCVSMYFAGLDKSLKETAFFAVVGAIGISQQVVFLLNQDNLRKLLDSLDGFERRRSPKEKEFFVRESKRTWKMADIYWRVLMTYWFFVFFLPVVLDLTAGWINPEVPSLRVPIPMKGFIDMVRPRSLSDVLISAVAVLYTIVSLSCHVGMEMSLIFTIVAVRSEMKIVCLKLERLKRLLDTKLYDSRISLNDVVIHHQYIMKMLDVISSVFGLSISMQNSIVAGCLCVLLYQTTTVKNTEDLQTAVQGMFGLVVLLCLVLYLCMEGESLETQNNEIQQCLYDLSWYKAPPGFRKDLTMMIRQAQKPYVISYHDMFHLNMATFMQIINTSYSYFMMLKSTGR